MPESECGVRAPATVKVVHGGLELQRGAPVVHDGIVHAVEVRLNDEDQLVGDEQVALLPLRPARAGGLPVLSGDPRACERKCPGSDSAHNRVVTGVVGLSGSYSDR